MTTKILNANPSNKLVFVTGASGAGKTEAVKYLADNFPDLAQYYFFDSVGVPTAEDMIKVHGSGEAWRQNTTLSWVRRIKESQSGSKPMILEGQIGPEMIVKTCAAEGVTNYQIILLTCTELARFKRLSERGQPELANENMRHWAERMLQEAIFHHADVIRTSRLTLPQVAQQIREMIRL